jgi:hypothetical protein
MTMREWLKQRIKKLFENTESTITNIILLALFGGSATILAVSKKALSVFLQIINTPTPLWATISLVLLGCGYIYLKFRKLHSSSLSQKVEKPQKTSAQKIKYFTLGNYKWKVDIYPGGGFSMDIFPICAIHDLKFIIKGDGMSCPDPGCKNTISKYDDYKIHATAESHIEKEIRNNPEPPPQQRPQLPKSNWVTGWRR